MKRREFLKSAGAVAAVPAMPAIVTASMPAPAIAADLLSRAINWSGMWDKSSVEMLKYRFDLDDGDAKSLLDHLVDRKILAKPNSNGIAKVIHQTLEDPFPADDLHFLIRGKFAPISLKTSSFTDQNSVEPIPEKPTAQMNTSENKMSEKIEGFIEDQIEDAEEQFDEFAELQEEDQTDETA